MCNIPTLYYILNWANKKPQLLTWFFADIWRDHLNQNQLRPRFQSKLLPIASQVGSVNKGSGHGSTGLPRTDVSGLHLLGGDNSKYDKFTQNCWCLIIPEILDDFPSFFPKVSLLCKTTLVLMEIPGTASSMGMKLGKVGRGSLYLEDHSMTCNWLVKMVRKCPK